MFGILETCTKGTPSLKSTFEANKIIKIIVRDYLPKVLVEDHFLNFGISKKGNELTIQINFHKSKIPVPIIYKLLVASMKMHKYASLIIWPY